MRAKVSRFYGWTPDEVRQLSIHDFYEYLTAADVLSSEEQLYSVEASLAPHIKQEKRKELITKYSMKIKKLIDRTQGKLATVEDLAKAFSRMKMNG